MAVNRTNGGPGCSALEGVLQENGVNLYYFSNQPYFYPHLFSLSPGALEHEDPSRIHIAGTIFPL